jgi:hypothetical protein
MSVQTESFNKFVSSMGGSKSVECVERMASFSQRRRRGSNPSIYSKASNASTISISSTSSLKSTTPVAIDLNSALYQKGFDLRQFDSSAEFDKIVDYGYNGNVGERMPTLKLTLTPQILRC